MRNRLQIYLSAGLFVVTLLGFILFSLLAQRLITHELVQQIIEDNRVFGERVLETLVELNEDSTDSAQTLRLVQTACERLELPNGGFICATDMQGNLIAAPDFDSTVAISFDQLNVNAFDNMEPRRFESLGDDEVFRGLIRFPDDNRTDIVYSRALPEYGLRLLVHQNLELVNRNAWRYIRPLMLLGAAIAALVMVISYVFVRRTVNSYESELRALNDDLRRTNEDLLAVNNERKQLLHLLSHDLANPLGGIINALDLIRMDPDHQPQYEKIIRMGAENCIGIINLVRQIQALDSGKIDLSLTSVNLREAVTHSLEMIEGRARPKGVQFQLDIADDLLVQAELVSLVNSVLNNLLTNAIKFSPGGGRIELEARRSRKTILLTVRDHGIGMPPGLLENLFSLSYKTSRTGTDGEKGTGFGMPLVKRFVESYGGIILVQSREERVAPEDHGTEVSLWFRPAEADA